MGHSPSMGTGLGPGLSLSGILEGSVRPSTASQGGRGQGGSGGLLPGHGGSGGGVGLANTEQHPAVTPQNNESMSTGLSSRHFGGHSNASQNNHGILNRDMTGEGGVGEGNHGTDVNNNSNNRPQTSSGRPLTPSTLHLLHQRQQQQQQHGGLGMGSPYNGGGRGTGTGPGTAANTGTSFHASQQQQPQLPRPSTTGGQQMTRIRSPHAGKDNNPSQSNIPVKSVVSSQSNDTNS